MRTTFFLLILSLTSCSKSLKKFYYKADAKEVAVYKYRINGSINEFEYWKVSAVPSQSKILTESFNSELRLYNTFEEIFDKDGAKLIDFIEYERLTDGTEKVNKAIVVENEVYNWNKDQKCRYSIEYDSQYGKIKMKKERIFESFEDLIIGNAQYKTAKFKDDYTFEAVKYKDVVKYYQYAYYTKDIGMVRYERYLPDGNERILDLEEILSEEEFIQVKKDFH